MGWSGIYVNGTSRSQKIREALEVEFRGDVNFDYSVDSTSGLIWANATTINNQVATIAIMVSVHENEVLLKTLSAVYKDDNGNYRPEASNLMFIPKRLIDKNTTDEKEALRKHRQKAIEARKFVKANIHDSFTLSDGTAYGYYEPTRQYVIRRPGEQLYSISMSSIINDVIRDWRAAK